MHCIHPKNVIWWSDRLAILCSFDLVGSGPFIQCLKGRAGELGIAPSLRETHRRPTNGAVQHTNTLSD